MFFLVGLQTGQPYLYLYLTRLQRRHFILLCGKVGLHLGKVALHFW
ncbi:MAG: hypothetical protein FD153_2074 [Rhodospirillaceae bacterium]|nr:MAG: hypothetical protein FD153_2074 [Rhodospirillaceae bacterium]